MLDRAHVVCVGRLSGEHGTPRPAITDRAESINDARRSIWGDVTTVGKLLILVVLIAPGIDISIIVIALVMQAIAG